MKTADIAAFFATLKAANPMPVTELEYTSVFELLTAVLLSAQATDVGVNKATRPLFTIADTPQKMLALGEDRVRDYIKTIGLFRNNFATQRPRLLASRFMRPDFFLVLFQLALQLVDGFIDRPANYFREKNDKQNVYVMRNSIKKQINKQ